MAAATIILVVSIFAAFLYLIQQFAKNVKLNSMVNGLPGPKTLPIFGNALMFTGDVTNICNTIISVTDLYPSLWRAWIGPRLFIVIYDPVHMKAVCTSPSAIHKSEIYDYLKPFAGEGLLSAPATKWQVHRKCLSRAFHLNAMKPFLETFVKHTNVFVQKLEATNGKEIEIYDYVALCALDIIYETMMDIELHTQNQPDCKVPAYIMNLLEVVSVRIFKLWLHLNIIFYNSSSGKEEIKCSNYINAYTDKVINKKKAELEANPSKEYSVDNEDNEKNTRLFLDLVIELSKAGEQVSVKDMENKDVRAEINTMTVAGTDTSACSVSFVLLMLATFPEIQDKVYQELYELYGSSDPLEVPVKYNDLQHMNYLERVMKETLRLFPAAPIIVRKVTEDIKVNDVTIPKGSSTVLAIFKLHRYDKFWPDPLKFDPDRFLPENVAARHPFCYIPFSGGPRNCIGAKYAVTEMKAILATTLRKFIVTVDKPVPIKDIQLKLHIVLKPVKPIMLRFKKRL